MTISKGFAAESAAARYLASRGCFVIARNHHCREGEVDIICRDGEMLVFCEVKQRNAGVESALQSVSKRKRDKLVAAAMHFLANNPQYEEMPTRFDVLAVTPDGELWRVFHLKDAFRPGD